MIPTFLDLATNSGFASRALDGTISYGSFAMPNCGADLGRFFHEFTDHLDTFIAPLGSTVVVYEAPFLGPDTALMTARKLHGLCSFLEYWCRRRAIIEGRSIRVAEETNQAVRGHFVPGALGVKLPKKEKREYLKRVVLERCRALGWTPANDDEGDALAGLDLTLHRLKLGRPSPPPGGLFHPGDTP